MEQIIQKVILSQAQFTLDAVRLAIALADRLLKMLESGELKPGARIYIVALWRGGAEIGHLVQRILIRLLIPSMLKHYVFPSGVDAIPDRVEWLKKNVFDHIAVRTSSYSDGGSRKKVVDIHGGKYVLKGLRPGDLVILVDDVFDEGRTMQAMVNYFGSALAKHHSFWGRFLGVLGALAPSKWNKFGRRFVKLFAPKVTADDVSILLATNYYKPEKNQTNPRIEPDIVVQEYSPDDWLVFPPELDEYDQDGKLILVPSQLEQVYGKEVVELIRAADMTFGTRYEL